MADQTNSRTWTLTYSFGTAVQIEAKRGAQAVQAEHIQDNNLFLPLLCTGDAHKADSYWHPSMKLVIPTGNTLPQHLWYHVQVEAERGAQAVQVEYIQDDSLGSPLLCIGDAIQAGSYYDPPMDLVTTIGDAKAALKKAQYTIKDAR